MNALNRKMISLPKFHSCAILQDDNARPRTARIVRDHLQARHIPRMEWPACSPDLKPIKQLNGISWGRLYA